MKKLLLAFSLVGAVFQVGCGPSGNKPNIELIQDMMVTPALKAQEGDDTFADGIGGRVPPAGTQPVGFTPYAFATNIDGARANKNPMSGDMTPELLITGQKYFETNCAVCHGHKLGGDGSVAAKYPLKIPPLNSDKIKGWTDGEIYHVITVGQGVMGPYASHIPQNVRWQVVNYIRHLQKSE